MIKKLIYTILACSILNASTPTFNNDYYKFMKEVNKIQDVYSVSDLKIKDGLLYELQTDSPLTGAVNSNNKFVKYKDGKMYDIIEGFLPSINKRMFLNIENNHVKSGLISLGKKRDGDFYQDETIETNASNGKMFYTKGGTYLIFQNKDDKLVAILSDALNLLPY